MAGQEANRHNRYFNILEFLATSDIPVTVTDLSSKLGLPVSSAHDTLRGLAEAGLVAQDSQKTYRLGSRARNFAELAGGMQFAVEIPFLQQLSDQVGLDVYFAAKSAGQVVYVYRVRGRHPVNVNFTLGTRLFLHATAVGKLFSALDDEIGQIVLNFERPLRQLTEKTIADRAALSKAFDQIKQMGYSTSLEEALVGVNGLAYPIFGSDDRVRTALHVSGLAAELVPEKMEEVLGHMRKTAKKITEALQ